MNHEVTITNQDICQVVVLLKFNVDSKSDGNFDKKFSVWIIVSLKQPAETLLENPLKKHTEVKRPAKCKSFSQATDGKF
jgi:hypothetical protein